MQKKHLIGIDGGSQSSKVVIFDLDGNIVSTGRQQLQAMHMPARGVAEHPGDDLWVSIAAAARQAMQHFNGDPGSILGVGLCTIRCCRALLKADGSLAAPVINWMDQRLAQSYQHQDPQVRYVTTSSGYLTHRFTGEFRDTAANYEGMWPIDKELWQWSSDPAVLAACNIPPEMLFELVMPGAILGYVSDSAAQQTGVPAGIPVVATANDKAVEALGAGLPAGNTALVSLGTYIGGMVYGQAFTDDSSSYFCNMASMPQRYLFESGGIRYGMSTVSWFKELLGPSLLEEAAAADTTAEQILNREAAAIAAGSDGLMTVPEWLAPPGQPFKRGIMIGFHGGHRRGHIFRSMLEAIALTMKNRIEQMCDELEIELQQIIVSGGGSNGDLTMQIFADVFNLPAIRNVVNEAAALGAAINTSIAVQAHDCYATAIARMVRTDEKFSPNPHNASVYENLNNTVYRDITRHTDRILEKCDKLQLIL